MFSELVSVPIETFARLQKIVPKTEPVEPEEEPVKVSILLWSNNSIKINSVFSLTWKKVKEPVTF